MTIKTDFKSGDVVILKECKKSILWNSGMAQFIGREFVIRALLFANMGVALVGCPYFWPLDAIEKKKETVFGAVCTKCNSRNEYIEASDNYICAICKGWSKLWNG